MSFMRLFEVTCDWPQGCLMEGRVMAKSQAEANVKLTKDGWMALQVAPGFTHYCPKHNEMAMKVGVGRN